MAESSPLLTHKGVVASTVTLMQLNEQLSGQFSLVVWLLSGGLWQADPESILTTPSNQLSHLYIYIICLCLLMCVCFTYAYVHMCSYSHSHKMYIYIYIYIYMYVYIYMCKLTYPQIMHITCCIFACHQGEPRYTGTPPEIASLRARGGRESRTMLD